jgi:hypothetical protein
MLTVLTHIRSFEVVQMRLKAEESATLSAIGTVLKQTNGRSAWQLRGPGSHRAFEQ